MDFNVFPGINPIKDFNIMGPMAVPEAKNTKYCIPVKTRALHNFL